MQTALIALIVSQIILTTIIASLIITVNEFKRQSLYSTKIMNLTVDIERTVSKDINNIYLECKSMRSAINIVEGQIEEINQNILQRHQDDA